MPEIALAINDVTDNTISVDITKVKYTSDVKEYRYYIKEDTAENYVLKSTTTSTSYTYKELTEETKYDVLVEVEDKFGNVGKTELSILIPIPIPEGFSKSMYDGEKTVGEGLVIYKTDVSTLATKDQETAKTSYDQFVWVPVPNMDEFTRTAWSNNIPTNILSKYYTEPSSYNASTAYQYITEVAEYNAMKNSVEKYGGFYIARYEAGDLDVTSMRTTYTTGAHTVVSRKGAFVYNYVGWGTSMTDITSDVIDSSNNNKGKGAVYLSQNMYVENNNYTTSLIYGVQWDATLRWLSDKYNVSDSRSWGNYYNSTGDAATNSGSSKMNYTTGRSEAWKAKNIYDLAGNVWEWTMEADSTVNRVLRGGVFYSGGGVYPASFRYNYGPIFTNNYYGFRPALYLD